ncbi:MAG: hypothetical protein ABJM18_06860 [Hyphomonas sp.]|uniref:hypothetical protein n=1 Tax=Hyphomonas sp. TaxID=87 RepID=UPI003298BEB3
MMARAVCSAEEINIQLKGTENVYRENADDAPCPCSPGGFFINQAENADTTLATLGDKEDEIQGFF